MKKYLSLLLFIILQVSLSGQSKTGSWGDQMNGTYKNPVLNSDYSDPDVIRMENKYYMVYSEFNFMGIPVLLSDDMVNWKIVGRVYDSIGFQRYDTNRLYKKLQLQLKLKSIFQIISKYNNHSFKLLNKYFQLW